MYKEENARIFVTDQDGNLLKYKVYENRLIEPDDLQTVADLAGEGVNPLVLITCENENISGGYIDRRVVFATQID